MVLEKDYNVTFLLSELQQGRESAFDFIFRKYYKALCAQANGYVHDTDLAQSLVQDCFIKFWEHRSQAGQIESLPGYLSFMVRNCCIDYLRKKKEQTDLLSVPDTSEESSSDVELLSREFEEKLVVALSHLPERCRQAFEYSRFENLSYTEIAERMDISVKAVEALISRALKTLRLELKDYLPILLLLYNLPK